MNADIINDIPVRLRPLVGNVNAIDVMTLCEWLRSGEVREDGLAQVLDVGLVDDVLRFRDGGIPFAPLVATDQQVRGDEERTEVYFWGLKGVGKTSVIGSVIAAQPGCASGLNTESARERAAVLGSLYAETGSVVAIPDEQTVSLADGIHQYDIINADLADRHGRKHPVALIEPVGTEDAFYFPTEMLTCPANDKIHVFCYDATREGDVQDKAIMGCLRKLQEYGVLSHSTGIYLLVTKVDAIPNVPRQYRFQAAQSLVTASHRALWEMVKNACYAVKIHGATPIPFSIGDVRLRRLVRVDLTHAREFIDKPLLVKTRSYQSRLGRALRKGPWWLTALVIMAALGTVGYFAYTTFEAKGGMPVERVEKFSFKDYFLKREDSLMRRGNATMINSLSSFNQLDSELEMEYALRLQNGRRVLEVGDYKECRGRLYNDFAEIVHGGFRYEFRSKDWSEGTLERLMTVSGKLLESTALSDSKRTALREARSTVRDYYEAKRIIELSYGCSTQEDVDVVTEGVGKYRREPLTNDLDIAEGLAGAVQRARKGYERARSERNFDPYSWLPRFRKLIKW